MSLFERIDTCGLVRGGVSLGGEDGMGFEVSEAQVRASGSLSPLPAADPDLDLLASSPAPCCHASHHGNNRLNLRTVSQPS